MASAQPPNPTLKDIRLRLMLTVDDISNRAGISRGAVIKIESGEHDTPHEGTLIKLLDALRIARDLPLPEPRPDRPPRPVWAPMTVDRALRLRDIYEARAAERSTFA